MAMPSMNTPLVELDRLQDWRATGGGAEAPQGSSSANPVSASGPGGGHRQSGVSGDWLAAGSPPPLDGHPGLHPVAGSAAAKIFAVARFFLGRRAYHAGLVVAGACMGAKLLMQAKGASTQNQLVEFLCYVVAFSLLTSVPLFGMRKALEQDQGHLERLGMSTYHLSRKELKVLQFWSLFVVIFSSIIICFGLNDIIRQVIHLPGHTVICCSPV